MKIDDNLNKVFNLEPAKEEKEPMSLLPVEVPEEEQQDADYQLARGTLRNLITKNDAVLDTLIDLARNSEHPRAYEVAGQLIKTQSEMAKDLLEVHKKKKEISGDTTKNYNTTNNIVFAGSTSELMKVISAERAKVIDSK